MEWISVKDRCPSEEKEYIVYVSLPNDRSFVTASMYYTIGDEWTSRLGAWSTDVTHWMELPGAPEGE